MTNPTYDVLIALEDIKDHRIKRMWASELIKLVPNKNDRDFLWQSFDSKQGCEMYIKEYKNIIKKVGMVSVIDTRIYKYNERPEIDNLVTDYKITPDE